ncbi:MAG: PQQ-binding-like beta-propeller repeat protein [Planctomycetota bacterium]|nr:PQQ-binding-like beta-propeller repeat protein [Planctomycetota bacterium]
MHRIISAMILYLFLAAASWTLADERVWPGWLGAKRDGWVAKFEPPSEWPSALIRAWELPVGTGYGSPLVSGNRVIQHARQGEEEILVCIDLTSGQELWKSHHTVPFKMGGGGEWHGKGPKSCPTLADGRVFTLSITGVLSAWRVEDGELIWRQDYSEKFGKAKTPYWGACTSPIVVDKTVVVHLGSDDEGMLVCFDATTGKELWTSGSDGAAYSSPLLVTIHGVRQIVEWNHNGLAGIVPETGERLWFFSLPHIGTQQNMPTPSVYENCILVGGENRGVRRIDLQVASGKWDATQTWLQKDVALDMSSAVMNGELLYGFSHYGKGRLFCLESDSGKILWEGTPRSGQNATLLSMPGQVAVLLDGGKLQLIEASGGGFRELKSYQVSDSPTWAPPVILKEGLLIKARESLIFWKW